MAKEYIEREYAVKLSNDIIRMVEDLRACDAIDYNTYSEIFDMLCGFDTIPAADVAPVRRGRWIVERDDYFGFKSVEIKCSECNSHPKDDEMTSFFCPNCGAKMREVREDGD